MWLRFRSRGKRSSLLKRRARSSVVDRQCDCAERTGELVVFTCPLCMVVALESISFEAPISTKEAAVANCSAVIIHS